MDRIPLEVLHLIFSGLTARYIPCCRLVCRQFAHVGIHHLEVGKHFYFRTHSLKRLEHIANHPVLSSRISDLVFFVDVLPVFDTKDEWLDQARGTCHTRPKDDDQICFAWLQKYDYYGMVSMARPDIPMTFIEAAWNDHQAIRKEQERLLSDLDDTLAGIRFNFSKLSNLESFSLETFGPFHRDLMRPLYTLRPAEQSWYCCNYTCSLSSFETVCPAILAPVIDGQSKSTFLSLQTLEINATDFADFNGLSPQVSTSNSSLRQIQSISLSSTQLQSRLPTSIYSSMDRSQCNDEDNGPFLQNVFVNAPNLALITIKVEAEPQLNTKTIFCNCVWNNLQKLDLTRVDIEKSTFELFLLAHAETLHTLILRSADIQSEIPHQAIWIDFLTFIQRTMNLTDFDLDGFLSESDGQVEFDVDQVCTSNVEGETIPIHRIIRYLVCGKACASHGRPDDFTQTLIGWHTLSWTDIEDAYI